MELTGKYQALMALFWTNQEPILEDVDAYQGRAGDSGDVVRGASPCPCAMPAPSYYTVSVCPVDHAGVGASCSRQVDVLPASIGQTL